MQTAQTPVSTCFHLAALRDSSASCWPVLPPDSLVSARYFVLSPVNLLGLSWTVIVQSLDQHNDGEHPPHDVHAWRRQCNSHYRAWRWCGADCDKPWVAILREVEKGATRHAAEEEVDG